MAETLRDRALRWLRVPPQPQPPVGEPGPLRVFRAAPGYLRYTRWRWAATQLGALIGLITGLAFLSWVQQTTDNVYVSRGILIAELAAWAGFLAQLPVTWLLLRLDFDMRWYLVSGRSLRIREGLLTVREQTLTFANVQQITVRQGPLQRLFGIADLEVRTAGGGSAEQAQPGHGGGVVGHSMHVGYFRGVDDAAAIRDLVRERVSRHRDAGLGDPDDQHHEGEAHPGEPAADSAPAGALIAAARELGDAAAGLREVRRALAARHAR